MVRSDGRCVLSTYDLFVSYARTDTPTAGLLQDRLSRVGAPWYRRRSLRVFRDETDLTANPDLWESVAAALDDSRWLLVVGTSAACASDWVDREIRRFLADAGPQRVVLALVEGVARWDPVRARWDGDLIGVPPALRELSTPPNVVDARSLARPTGRRGDDPEVLDAVSRIAAPVLGTSTASVRADDARQRGRTRLHVAAAVGLVAVLAVTSLVLAVVAIQRQRVVEQRAVEARSQQLAARAVQLADEQPHLAILIAAQAWRIAATPEAQRAVLLSARWAPRELDWRAADLVPIRGLLWWPDSAQAAAGRDDGSVLVWWPDRREAQLLPATVAGAAVVGLAHDGPDRFVAVAADGSVAQYDRKRLELLARGTVPGPVRGADSAGAANLVWITEAGQLSVRPIDGGAGPSVATDLQPMALATSADHGLVAIIGERSGGNELAAWTLPELRPVFRTAIGSYLGAVSFSGDGSLIGVLDVVGVLRTFRASDGSPVGESLPIGGLGAIELVPWRQAEFLASMLGNNQIGTLTAAGSVGDVYNHHHAGAVLAIAASDDVVISSGTEGSLERHQLGVSGVSPFVSDVMRQTPELVWLAPTAAAGRTPTFSGGQLFLVDIPSGRQTAVPGFPGARAAALAADGRRLAVDDAQGFLSIVDTDTNHVLSRTKLESGGRLRQWIDDRTVLTFAEPSALVAVDHTGLVQPLTRPTGTFLGEVVAAATDPSGRVAAAYARGTVAVWPSATEAPVHIGLPALDIPSALAFDRDGRSLWIAGSLGTVRRYDTETLQPDGRPIGTEAGPVRLLVSDGHGLLTVVTSNSIAMFDESGALLAADALSSIRTASAAGTAVLFARGDGIGLWAVDFSASQRRACALAPSNVDSRRWEALTGIAVFEDPCAGLRPGGR